MMASDDEEDLLDRVYLQLMEKRYADGTSENCMQKDKQKESFEICNDIKHYNQLADKYQLCKNDCMHA